MPNPVIVDDLEARFRPLSDEERDVAQALVDDAWAVLLMVVPDIEDRMTAGTVSPEVATYVVASMALRVLRNPNGVRSWSLGDYSETRDNALSAGALYVSDAEAALLTGRASSARRRAFSITPYSDPVRSPGSESDASLLHYLRYGEWL